MRQILLPLIIFLSIPSLAQGQTRPIEKFTDTPICSDIRNESGYAIYGSVETDKVQEPGGDIIYYKSNFRLKADENTQICSNGPFFDGQKLRLTLRSLFPLFECYTSLGAPIVLNATRKEGGQGYDWSATCH